MEERKSSPSAPPPVPVEKQPVKTDAHVALEAAFARGSGHINDEPPAAIPERIERTEHSVMEGLPAHKAERVAAMRRELADLQRQLSEAQQRIAKEVQARAEDDDRNDALEARLQELEAKAQEDVKRHAEEVASVRSQLSLVTSTTEELRREVAARDTQLEEARQQQRTLSEQLEAKTSSLNEAKTLLAEAKTLLQTRDSELTSMTTERDTERANKAKLERELEEQRKQHGEVTSQLDAQATALRDANATIAARDSELAAATKDRDAFKGELAAARIKMRDVAAQIARAGQDLTGEVGDAVLPAVSVEAPPIKVEERQKPPPVPVRPEIKPAEPIVVMSEEPKSSSRTVLAVIGGVILGCVATFAFVKLTSASPNTTPETDPAAAPSAALVSEQRAEPTPAVVPPAGEPSAPTDIEVPAAQIETPPAAAAAAAPEGKTDGVLVLPQEADDHRLFVDGKVVPVKNLRAVVQCGTREIRIGSRGTLQKVDVACGGETTVPSPPDR